jgi:hypothetical protein
VRLPRTSTATTCSLAGIFVIQPPAKVGGGARAS